MPTHVNVLTREIIGSAIEVHRKLGPACWSRLIRNAWPGNSYYEEYP